MQNLTHERAVITIDGKEYTVKRLGLQNAFQFLKLLKSANIVHQFTRLMNDFDNGESYTFVPLEDEQIAQLNEDEQNLYQRELAEWKAEEPERQAAKRDRMVQTALNLIFSMEGAENEVYALLGSLIGMPKEDTKDLPLDATVDILEAIFKAPDLKSFFNAIKKLLPKADTIPAATPVAN
jgi:hypothetical protein